MRVTWIVSAATAIVLLGASILAFLNPVWVGFEQDRVGVALAGPDVSDPYTGFCHDGPIARITGSILHDVVLGGEFDVAFDSTRCRHFGTQFGDTPVLTAAERSHMRDVRAVFQGLYVLVAVSVLALLLTFRLANRSDARGAWLRAVRRGAGLLAIAVAALGAVSLVAFDAAFEAFHQLFFAAGTYDFDPRVSHLVQLFPDQFWSDTTLALGAVLIVGAGLVAWLATRGVAGLDAAQAKAGSPASLRVREVAR